MNDVSRVFAALLLLGSPLILEAETTIIKPLPVNRKTDAYESRTEFLKHAAAFETTRLRRLPFSHEREADLFSQKEIRVDLGSGISLHFLRVESSRYVDGFTPELRDKVLSIENRANDLLRWQTMFEVERRDEVTVPYDYYMSETIVTNAMFDAFVRETSYRTSVDRYNTGWVVDPNAQWLQGFDLMGSACCTLHQNEICNTQQADPVHPPLDGQSG